MITGLMLTAWAALWWALLGRLGNRWARLGAALGLALATQFMIGCALILLDPSLLE